MKYFKRQQSNLCFEFRRFKSEYNFFLVKTRNAIFSLIWQITLCYRDYKTFVVNLAFTLNFHGRTCVRKIRVLCEFELLTDDMEHSEVIKTNTTMCIYERKKRSFGSWSTTLEFQRTAVSQQQGQHLNFKPCKRYHKVSISNIKRL